MFVGVEHVGFGLLEFGVGDSEFEHTAEFVFEDGEGFLPALVGYAEVDLIELSEAEEVGGAGGAAADGRVWLFREALEAFAKDGVIDGVGDGFLAIFGVIFEILRGKNGGEGEAGGGDFGVGEDVSFEALDGCNGAELGIFSCIGGFLHRGKFGGDALFDFFGVETTDDDEGHAFGGVEAVVVVEEKLLGGVADDAFEADGEAVGDERIGKNRLKLFLEEAELDGIAHPFFGQDHAAFFVDFLWCHEGAVGEVAHDGVAELEDVGGLVGEVEHVHRLVERSECVHVGAEADAEALHDGDELAGFVVFGAVEDHVLDEVGETALVFIFHQRASVDVETHGYGVFWGVVGVNDVAESVGEFADDGFAVERDVGGFMGPFEVFESDFFFERNGRIFWGCFGRSWLVLRRFGWLWVIFGGEINDGSAECACKNHRRSISHEEKMPAQTCFANEKIDAYREEWAEKNVKNCFTRG